MAVRYLSMLHQKHADEGCSTDGQAAWSWRPKAGVKPATMLSHHAGDGDNNARSPGRARSKPFQPLRREGRNIRLYLWFLPRAFFYARGPWVSADTRPSLRPLMISRDALIASLGRCAPRGRGRVAIAV